jgi:hypothetical protein
MHSLTILACIVLAQSIASQEIQDIVSKDIRVYWILSAESSSSVADYLGPRASLVGHQPINAHKFHFPKCHWAGRYRCR